MPTSPVVRKKSRIAVNSKPVKDNKSLEARVVKLEKQVVELLSLIKRQKLSSKRFIQELRSHATDAYNFKAAVNKRK